MRFLNYTLLNASFQDRLGLFNGKSASALYIHELHMQKKNVSLNDTILDLLHEIQAQINYSTLPGFGEGIAGYCSMIEYFHKCDFIHDDINELLEEPEKHLTDTVLLGKIKSLDVNTGISGFGLFFLHRLCSKSQSTPDQQASQKQCLIKCVDVIAHKLSENSNLPIFKDLSISGGMSGILLFLNWVHKISLHEPATSQLICTLVEIIQREIKNAPFSWEKTEAFFSLIFCDIVNQTPEIKKKVSDTFVAYTQKAALQIQKANFYDASFLLLLFRLSADELNLGRSKLVSNELKQVIRKTIDKNPLNILFPYQVSEACVFTGLKGGISGTALPLLSLETGNYDWLSIFGLNIPDQKHKRNTHEISTFKSDFRL